jgi:hypothetical protein
VKFDVSGGPVHIFKKVKDNNLDSESSFCPPVNSFIAHTDSRLLEGLELRQRSQTVAVFVRVLDHQLGQVS